LFVSNNVVAESALDRLACGLGGKTMLPHIVNNIPQMLENPDWKYRHAALMAISAVGEGCHKQMETMLPQIMEVVIKYLMDPVSTLPHDRLLFTEYQFTGIHYLSYIAAPQSEVRCLQCHWSNVD